MAVIGFIMVLVNAIGYILDLNVRTPSLTILGLVFVVIGMKIAKKSNK